MLTARDLMQKHFVGVSRTTTIASALRLSASARVDLMPVLDGERLCGVVTSAALGEHRESGGNVGEVMESPVFVEADSDLDAAARIMISHGIGRVPVVEDKLAMICVGVLTSTDVVKAVKKP
jgi:CBS domain-containing protein